MYFFNTKTFFMWNVLWCALMAYQQVGAMAGYTDYLISAAQNGRDDEVRVLLQSGPALIDINGVDHYGQTALIHAAGAEHEDIVAILVKEGADLNKKSNFNMTALMSAAHVESAGSIRRLVAAGADVSFTNEDGTNALLIVARKDSLACIDTLLSTYADRLVSEIIARCAQQNIKNLALAKTTSLGHFDVLPLEVRCIIMRCLDLPSYAVFKQVNKKARKEAHDFEENYKQKEWVGSYIRDYMNHTNKWGNTARMISEKPDIKDFLGRLETDHGLEEFVDSAFKRQEK